MQNPTSPLNLCVFGHPSANPGEVATALGASVGTQATGDISCALFVVNPNTGIDQATIDQWQSFDEFLTPRMIVVTQLDGNNADFDDAVMLANRVFDQIATPYLVLHDDDGSPRALISLSDMVITDYSTTPPTKNPCEPEHETLVQEFRDEYLELVTSMGEGAFAAGVLFPAIPLVMEKGIGLDVIKKYLAELN
ncbi:elongation factor G-like protein [Candidatus Planktophila vernalis]|uniref:Elongation factor G-like protein n=1 Tax=Candidatus Planktophila vernalis TaxID=1884907 RepID=A0A249KT81_9ACTN|nr:hypothetical protein [Candidatus Planktophila vernalis]ASY19899.1 elongation factor G-like protein [Candidatus Planktophila vernalis]